MESKKFKRVLASDVHCCFYCGEHPQEREHYVPWVIARMPYYVMSCKECNVLLGSEFDETWTSRFERLIAKYQKRYRDLFIHDYESQMEDTAGGLRGFLESKIARRDRIARRLDVMEMMSELLYGEQYVTFHESGNLERINDFLRFIMEGRGVDESFERSDPSRNGFVDESSIHWKRAQSEME